MTNEFDINTLKLIAAATAHLQVNGIAGARVPMPGTDKVIVVGSQKWVDENTTPVPAVSAAEQSSVELTDDQAWKIATDLFGTFQYVSREGERVEMVGPAEVGEFARAAIAAHLARQSPAPEKAPTAVEPIGEVVGINDADGQVAVGVYGDMPEKGSLVYLAAPVAQEVEPGSAPAAADEVRDAALQEADDAIRSVLWQIENGDGLRDEVYGAERCRDAIRALKTTASASTSADGGGHA